MCLLLLLLLLLVLFLGSAAGPTSLPPPPIISQSVSQSDLQVEFSFPHKLKLLLSVPLVASVI